MILKEIQNRNYQATVKRGLITPATTENDFLDKIKEETAELEHEIETPFQMPEYLAEELADVILVCLAFAQHYNIDIENELIKKIIKNENRND